MQIRRRAMFLPLMTTPFLFRAGGAAAQLFGANSGQLACPPGHRAINIRARQEIAALEVALSGSLSGGKVLPGGSGSGSVKLPTVQTLFSWDCDRLPPPPPPPPKPGEPPENYVEWTIDLTQLVPYSASDYLLALSLPGFLYQSTAAATFNLQTLLDDGRSETVMFPLAVDAAGLRFSVPSAVDYWVATVGYRAVQGAWWIDGASVTATGAGSGTIGIRQSVGNINLSTVQIGVGVTVTGGGTAGRPLIT